MEVQVENAIQIAWNPHSEIQLKQQAIEFINQLRVDPRSWTVCLPLVTRRPSSSEIVQHTAIDVVNNAIQSGKVTQQELLSIKDGYMNYIRQAYGTRHDGAQDSVNIFNKFVEGLTYLFTQLYATEWSTFFDDLMAMTILNTSANSDQDSITGTRFYLKVVNSIHDEIADVLVAKSAEEQQRDTVLKDLIRDRDVQKIAATWQNILLQLKGKDLVTSELCLAGIGRWACWIDLNLIVNETFLGLLLSYVMDGVSNPSPDSAKLRDSSLNAYTEILSKKMRPADKISLIEVLKVEELVAGLTSSKLLSEQRFTSTYDTDFAEIVARLVNAAVFDIVIVLRDTTGDDGPRTRADQHLKTFIPYMLRFFSDDYDEICSIMIPSVTELLTFFRKKASDNVVYKLMLPSILQAIMNKMKYDESSGWGQEDNQTDEAEFQELRKRLQNLQQAIATIDETLYIDTISEMVNTCFESFKTNKDSVHWRDLDLALHEMFLFGQLAVKNGNIYSKSSPISPAAERLVAMMVKLVHADIASSSHPAIHLQFMEICVRYTPFFEMNPEAIPTVLEKFVQFVHHNHPKVKNRSWYLFHRFIKQLRMQLGNVTQTVIQAISDLLPIKAEMPEDEVEDDDMSSDEDDQSADARFTSQLYLYEAVGNICSSTAVPQENQILYIRTIISPLFEDVQRHLPLASSGDARAVLQIHHLILALGTFAHGYSDWSPNKPTPSSAPGKEIAAEFTKAGEAILVALEALNASLEIRTAARSSFSRMVDVVGNEILPQLPRWIQGLLSRASTKDEIAMFLRLLDQVVYGFKTEIFDILNGLMTPFLQRVFEGMQEPVTGTDDKIQLTELKEQYLTFILAVLSNDLGRVFISNENQPIFESLITTLEHFTKDVENFPVAKLAFTTAATMCNTWGGPDVVERELSLREVSLREVSINGMEGEPALPGFDRFMIERFSPLVWALPGNTAFSPRDAQAKNVLGEAAGLQIAIYHKIGRGYLTYLEQTELKNLGLSSEGIKEYLAALTASDPKNFKRYFQNLIQRLR